MDATPSNEGTPDDGPPFTEVMAGLVAAARANAGDRRGTPSDGADGKSPALTGEAEQLEPEPEPDARQPAAGQTLPVVQMQPAPAPVPAEWNFPMPGEFVSLSGGQASVAPETPVAAGTGLDLAAQGMEGVSCGREPQGQIMKTPALVVNPAGIDAKSEAGSANGAAADPLSPRPVPVESVLPPAGPGLSALPGVETSRKSSGSVVAQVLALSGLVPRTVDSIPPVEAAPPPVEIAVDACSTPEQRAAAQTAVLAKAASQSFAESLVPATDAQVRALSASTPDRDEIAFAVQMKAVPTSEVPGQRQSAAKLAADQASLRSPILAADPDVAAAEPAASGNPPSLSDESDQAPARAGRERQFEAAPTERTETTPATPAGKTIPQAAPDAQVRVETPPQRSDTTTPQPVRPQDAMDSETRPEAAKATPVRDLKFEVTGGERRVEVRVSERGGEVKMTVRTPDANLAGTLRENLPTLTARLAESGFKSQAWHPAAAPSVNEQRHVADPAAGSTSQDAGSQPRQHDREPQDGAGQRRPQSPQKISQKQKGTDFAWLMSSLR